MAEFSKLNYINVGPKGTFRPSGSLHTTAADIDAIFAHLAATNAPKLSVHFHGGLIKEAAGEAIARSMHPVFEAGGAHAVTFIWETGLIETLRRNITSIWETELFQKLVRYVFRQLTKRLGVDLSGRGAGEAMSMAEIELELNKVQKFEALDRAARDGAQVMDASDLDFMRDEMEMEYLLELQGDMDLANPEFLEEVPHLDAVPAAELAEGGGRSVSLFQLAKYLAKITWRVLKRYVQKRDHGLYPTVIEEIARELYAADFGSWVWGKMKDAGAQMWLPNLGPLDENAHPGRYFLEKLKAHQTAHPGFVVDLIGHSAGSIAICHMLRAGAKDAVLPDIRNILFLAPACLSQLMHAEVVRHPERFRMFRMFTMDDAHEQQDQLLKNIYTRSLLYLISGVLEEEADSPVAGMARFWTGAPPYDAPILLETASWLLTPGQNRVALSVSQPGTEAGMQTASTTHGDFDNDDLTRASLTHLTALA